MKMGYICEMFYTHTDKYDQIIEGHQGRPMDYPSLCKDNNLLFYIQRNQNINTVVYEANLLSCGLLNIEDPIHIYWIKYHNNNTQTNVDINHIQRALAYGCVYEVITPKLIKFHFAPYKLLDFYLVETTAGMYEVHFYSDQLLVVLNNIYVYAEDLGVFPQVKFAEIYGDYVDSRKPFYQKLVFDNH